MKLKDKMTLRESQKIAKLYEQGLEENMSEVICTIAVNDDGSDLKIDDIMDCSEEDLINIFGDYIVKKNRLMKSFTAKISE